MQGSDRCSDSHQKSKLKSACHTNMRAFSVRVLLFLSLAQVGLCIWTADKNGTSGLCYIDGTCGPLKWGGTCATGTMQSPIDITYDSNAFTDAATSSTLNIDSCYQSYLNFTLLNSGGHYALAQLNDDQTSDCVISGGLLNASYIFSQVHFHWGSDNTTGSEHTINGESYVMEAHFVHYRSDFASTTEAVASGDAQALTVVGVFFYIDESDNSALAPIVDSLSSIVSADSEVGISGIRIADFLLPTFTTTAVPVAAYSGSLTTPECSEVVQWRVMLTPVPISETQLEQFRQLQNSRGKTLTHNYRPVQALNGREITYFSATVGSSS